MQLIKFLAFIVQFIVRVMRKWLWVGATVVLLAFSSVAFSQTIVLVDADSTATTPDGDTWATAFKHLQDGIVAAMSSLPAEIWVANGTYYPDEGSGLTNNSRVLTFRMANDLVLLGGFVGPVGGSGGETSKQQRNPLLNITILSGDIQQDDDPEDPDSWDDNSFHIVTAVKVDLSAVIDGFTIRAGNADGAEAPDYPDIDDLISDEVGAGILLLGKHTASSADACWPLVMRCRFELNRADYGAAAFYTANQASQPVFGNYEFRSNVAQVSGAGFYNMEQISEEVQGGAATFVNCLFAGNQAQTGAAIFTGGLASTTLISCTIADNEAQAGGVDSIVHFAPCPIPTGSRDGTTSLLNCIVYASAGQQLAGPTVANHTWVKELDEICTAPPNADNREGNPEFIGGSPPNYRLQTTSDCIDTGSNGLAFASDPGDINQNNSTGDMMVELDQRIRISGVFGATTCAIDRGAYELTSGGCRGDTAPSPGGNNAVDVDDLIMVILHWGACPTPPALCPGDVVGGNGTCGNGTVDVDDLVAIILNWGPCPGLPPGTPPIEGTIESYEDCVAMCEGLSGEAAMTCLQNCFYYLCHEKGLTQFCE